MVYFNYYIIFAILKVVFLPEASSFFITPSSDIKSIMRLSSDSPSESDSKENNDRIIEIESVRRPISGESKDFKDYEEYFERSTDVYVDDSNNTTEKVDSLINSTTPTFPLTAHIFIDKMLPIFDSSKEKKLTSKDGESSDDGRRKVDVDTSNLF
uniref:Uncharacterized protein n=1 Tax=Strongyloides papillosus TaxID=174720 RepID=A0A0N5B7C3_STREA